MSELNREQIIKALECCASEKYICEQYPIDEKTKDDCECGKVVARNALALIKELTARNEILEAINKVNDRVGKEYIEASKRCKELTEENERLRAEKDTADILIKDLRFRNKVQIPNIYRMSIDGDFEVIGNSIDNSELLTAERIGEND